MKTYDENNLHSMTNFVNDWQNFDENDTDFFRYNFTKTVHELNKLSENQYDEKRTYCLMFIKKVLLFRYNNPVLFESCNTNDLFCVYNKMLNRSLEKEKFLDLKSYNLLIVRRIFGSLTTLVMSSDAISIRNTNENFPLLAILFLNKGNFLTKDKLNNTNYFDLCYGLYIYLCNSSNCSENRENLKKMGICDYLLNELQSLDAILNYKNELKYVKDRITLTLSRLVDETDLNGAFTIASDYLISSQIESLKTILHENINSKLTLNNTRYYTTYKIGYSDYHQYAWQCLNDLCELSINDKNKEKIFNHKIIELLGELFTNGNDREKELTCKLVCSLCFSNEIVKYLKENQFTLGHLNSVLSATKNANIIRYCEQINEMVNRSVEKIRLDCSNAPKNGPIMISYHQKYKQQCSAINDELKKKGYTTWIDVEHDVDMHDNDKLVKLIQNASVVLICYSDEYKCSTNSRYEAEYAAILNKNLIPVKLQENYIANGWLGNMLNGKFWTDLSQKTNLSASYDALFKQIESVLNVVEPISPASSQLSSLSTKTQNKTTPENWTCDEVKAFFESKNLVNISNALASYDGCALKALWSMYKKDYKQFCDLITEETQKSNVSIREKLTFYGNLEILFDQ